MYRRYHVKYEAVYLFRNVLIAIMHFQNYLLSLVSTKRPFYIQLFIVANKGGSTEHGSCELSKLITIVNIH